MAKGTVVQKIIDEHFVYGDKAPGKPAAIRIDQTLTQDATGTMAYLELEAMKVPRVKTEISVSYVDHNMMQNGPENRNDHMYLQSVAAAKGVYFSPPGNGICHQVHLERFGVPGKTLLGSDSHTPTGGGIGMIAIGAGGLDVALAMAGEPFRLTYPKVIGVKLTGKLSPWCAAKDIILKLLDILSTKGNVGCIVEYFGEGVTELSVPQRATVTNMGAELGVTTSVFPSDASTKAFLEAQGRENQWVPLQADSDAEYDRVIEINLSDLQPLAACPSSPDNIRTVKEMSGNEVSQVIIGSCTNSSFRDLALVATVLKGRKVNPNVTLAIAPGSRQVLEMLSRNGMLADLIAAGARVLETGCGPCIGQGQSPADDTVTLRTFNRNFAGRTGTKCDQAYLVSPETAVAAALTGKFTDPRELDIACPCIADVEKFLINDNFIIAPAADGSKVEIVRKRTIGNPPENCELPNEIDGKVIIKVGDKITTDHIMPAGIHLKLRSNIPEYSKVVFECFTEEGKPSFAERASAVRDAGRHGIIVGRDSYGQGSSREHAAICPMYLGIKAVIAFAIERIHAANLINFGILPLVFADQSDYDKIEQDDTIKIDNTREQLGVGLPVIATICKPDGSNIEITLKHNMSQEDIDIVLAGGRLNCV
ncbi:aconitate hydratase [Lentisphaerota bacterium ZTH]|nr:aconitate hydratase [Lentisphaerota bacterium]WET07690.1 aconitate hydratase [Lentisphaerota bacterium ZTH]